MFPNEGQLRNIVNNIKKKDERNRNEVSLVVHDPVDLEQEEGEDCKEGRLAKDKHESSCSRIDELIFPGEQKAVNYLHPIYKIVGKLFIEG